MIGYPDLLRLMSLMTGDEKHASSATSTLDVLWVLYDQVLRVDPARPRDPGRDRFLLSKGHGPMAFYAVLAAKGFISEERLAAFGRHESILGAHPDRTLVPGVEIASGSLGHGRPIAVGVSAALGAGGEGWSTVEVDGRDHAAIKAALTTPHAGSPHVVVGAVETKE